MTTSNYFAAASRDPSTARATPKRPRGVLATIRARKRRREDAGSSSLTEMERQVVELRARHRDMLLLFECGYRMRVFAEDADVRASICVVLGV